MPLSTKDRHADLLLDERDLEESEAARLAHAAAS